MQEVFEKIIEKLEENSVLRPNSKEFYNNPQNGEYVDNVVLFRDAIEIVKQEAEKFAPDISVGSNGWIPCSSGVMPKEYIKKDGYTDPSEEVLVYIYYGENCVNNGCGVSRYWEHSEFHKNPWIDLKCGKENVVAWQPLPQPYQTKGE